MDGDDDEIRDMAVPRKTQAEGPGGEEERGYKVFTESWNHGKLSKQSGKVMESFSFEKSWDFHKLHS